MKPTLDHAFILSALGTHVTAKRPLKSASNAVNTDTRSLSAGNLFVALEGETFDGHQYLRQAVERGASGVVANREKLGTSVLEFLDKENVAFYHTEDPLLCYGLLAKHYFAQFSGVRIVVTGSAGKTTTKEFLATILKIPSKVSSTSKTPLANPLLDPSSKTGPSVFSSEKNYNNLVGVPQNIFNIHHDYDFYVLEIGTNTPGEIKRLANIINPHVMILTAINDAHMGRFESKDALIREKLSMIDESQEDAVLYLPSDIDYKERILEIVGKRVPVKEVIANEMVIENHIDAHGMWKNRAFYRYSSIEGIHLFSPFHARNFCMAFNVAKDWGVDETLFEASIRSVVIPPSRMTLHTGNPSLIDDSYNANVQSMIEALRWLSRLETNRKKIVVLGDILELGTHSKESHVGIGAHIRRIFSNRKDSEFYFVGREMRHAFKSSSLPCRQHFLRVEEVLDFIKNHLEREAIYFFKASFMMNFSWLVKGVRHVLPPTLPTV